MLSKITFVFLLNLKYVSQTDNTLSRIPKQAKKQQQTTGRSGTMWTQLILILMEHLNIGHKMLWKQLRFYKSTNLISENTNHEFLLMKWLPEALNTDWYWRKHHWVLNNSRYVWIHLKFIWKYWQKIHKSYDRNTNIL